MRGVIHALHAVHIQRVGLGGSGRGLLDFDLHADGARLRQRDREWRHRAHFEGLLEAEEHDVIAAGLEFERGAGLYFDPILHGPHFHHAVLVAGFVDLCFFRDGALSRNERIGLLAGVLDCEINGAVLALGRRARP